MYRGNSIGVVVPVYNEVDFVGEVIDDQPAFVDRTYVVDDRSTDGTWDEIQHRARTQRSVVATPTTDGGQAAGPEVVPIRHETNKGRGAAVKTGYAAALNDGMDVVAVMDGDGQMDPTQLDRLLDPVVAGEADYAKGNRLESRETRAEMSNWRLFGNALLTGLTRIASGYWGMTDPQNGYTAISRECLEQVDLNALYDRYGFLNDMLVRLNALDATIADVPMRAVYGDEESGIAYSSFVPALSLLLAHRFVWRVGADYDVVDFPPVPMLYGLAVACAVGGVGLALVGAVLAEVSAGLDAALVGLGLCLALVGFAFFVERRYNRHLQFDLGSESPLGNR